MKKYTLNFEWNRYKKGHIFESNDNGNISYGLYALLKTEVDLLVMSGALTVVEECKNPGIDEEGNKISCPNCSEVKKIEHLNLATEYNVNDMGDKINEIIDHINSNTKLK